MKVMKAEHIGFCFGVKRAMNRAKELLEEVPHDRIYMLGEMIHNPQVINDFQEKGIHIVHDISRVPSHAYLITRAHGIIQTEMKLAEQEGIQLIDTTCPYVKKLHKIADLLEKESYQIIIFGDPDHPEMKSLLSYTKNHVTVIQSADELKNHCMVTSGKIGLISQTTKDINEYKQILTAIFNDAEELRVFNTICKATILRQESARKLAQNVDVMIVVGGFNSANTNRLVRISKQTGVKTYHIENETQLQDKWFIRKKRVGVTSGASTPDYITERVIEAIKRMPKNQR